jgi:hypothetical protein
MLQRVTADPNHLHNVAVVRERDFMGVKPPRKDITIEATEARRRYSRGLKSHPPVTQCNFQIPPDTVNMLNLSRVLDMVTPITVE